MLNSREYGVDSRGFQCSLQVLNIQWIVEKAGSPKARQWQRVLLGRNREESLFALCLLLVGIACLVFVLAVGPDWASAIIERVEAGKKPKLEHFIQAGCWWSALVGGGLAFVLWASRKLWYFESSPPRALDGKGGGRLRWFVWVLLVMAVALAVRWPRMELGLYNDEADVFVRYIGGSFKGAAWDLKNEELPEYRRVSWASTFWGNKQGNNHVLFSVLARGCYSLYQRYCDGVPGEIHELPLRLPPLAGGLLSILMVALVLREMGSPQAGVFAAGFLALHPWHVRFSTEARGYGLLFGFLLVAVYFLVRALKEKRWSWWVAYGVFQCVYLYACLAGVYFALALNAAVVVFWLADEWLRGEAGKRAELWDWRPLQGLVAGNVLSLILFLFLMGPSIPQIARATETIAIFKQGMPSGLWPNVASYCAFGMPWYDGDPGNSMNPAVGKWFPGVVMAGGMFVVLVLFLFGLYGWWKTGMAGRVVVAGTAGSVGLVYGVNAMTGGTVLSWYLVYLAPIAAMTFGLGLAELLRLRGGGGTGRIALGNRIVLYGVVGVYALVVAKPIQKYRAIGKQAMRGAIVLARGEVYPFSEQGRKAITAGWWTNADIYDPYLKVAHKVGQLRYLMDKADREDRPFYFILGGYPHAVAEDASVVALLEESGEFETVRVFPGLEEFQYRQYVFRYRGGKRKALNRDAQEFRSPDNRYSLFGRSVLDTPGA